MDAFEKIGQLTAEEKLLIKALRSKEYRDQIISLLNKGDAKRTSVDEALRIAFES